jgi:hypothetical protein
MQTALTSPAVTSEAGTPNESNRGLHSVQSESVLLGFTACRCVLYSVCTCTLKACYHSSCVLFFGKGAAWRSDRLLSTACQA